MNALPEATATAPASVIFDFLQVDLIALRPGVRMTPAYFLTKSATFPPLLPESLLLCVTFRTEEVWRAQLIGIDSHSSVYSVVY